MAIGVIAHVRIKPGYTAEFEAVIARHTHFVRTLEPGNSLYRLMRDRVDPCSYAFMEIYDSLQALEIHRSMSVYEPGRKEIATLWDGQPRIIEYELIDEAG